MSTCGVFFVLVAYQPLGIFDVQYGVLLALPQYLETNAQADVVEYTLTCDDMVVRSERIKFVNVEFIRVSKALLEFYTPVVDERGY
ncbi:uncharacterized protein PG986_008427 [Apiospora aurea]|uniref:Uncharacterized protein n=1 Tax=Apiospora aurea TaxID=335848 RepID=A0ABR1QFD0_9PEZI